MLRQYEKEALTESPQSNVMKETMSVSRGLPIYGESHSLDWRTPLCS